MYYICITVSQPKEHKEFLAFWLLGLGCLFTLAKSKTAKRLFLFKKIKIMAVQKVFLDKEFETELKCFVNNNLNVVIEIKSDTDFLILFELEDKSDLEAFISELQNLYFKINEA